MTAILVDTFSFVVLQQTGDIGEAVLIGLRTVMDPYNFVLVVLASILGLIMGMLPGLGGPITIALLIPITFHLNPNVSIMIMAASLGGVAFGGSITAILLNTPGDAPNAATLIDGYPLAKQGKGGEAIAASAVASALGAIIGLALLVIMVPLVRPILFMFTSPEFFWLAVMGLVMIALATQGSVVADIAAAAFGLMFAFHGLNPVTGSARFTWGSTYLLDGIDLIPFIIGMFAVAEMIHLLSRRQSVSGSETISGGVLNGIKSVFQNPMTLFRASAIGWFIGTIPGVGGTLANFVAYFQEKAIAPDSDTFGTGNIKGVIASEASNDAKDGGSLLPTLALGIPGSASTAVLLGAFIAFGIVPGPILFRENLQLVFIIVFALLASNVIVSTIGLLAANPLTKVTKLPILALAPAVLFIALVGAYVYRNNIGDVVLAVAFGVFGFGLIKFGISRITMTIALVLGDIVENNFHRVLQRGEGSYAAFVERPASQAIVLLMVLVVFALLYKTLQNRQQKRSTRS